MKRHLAVTFVVLAACGGKQNPPSADDTEDPTPLDAAPVAVAPPDAAPPYEPPVDPPAWSDDVADLQTRLKNTSDDHDRLFLYAELGHALWTSACKAPNDVGLCLSMVARGKKAAPTCDGHTDDRKVAVRDAKVVNEANAAIGEVRQLWGDGSAMQPVGEPLSRADDAAYQANYVVTDAVTTSLLVIGDEHLEAMLAIPRPTGLDYGSKKATEASAKKVADWFDAFTKAAADAADFYAQIYGDPTFLRLQPAAVVVAMWRVALIQDVLMEDLGGMEVPKNLVKDQAGRDTYCAGLADKAEGMKAGLLDTLQQCVAYSEEHGIGVGIAPEWCKARLDELQP